MRYRWSAIAIFVASCATPVGEEEVGASSDAIVISSCSEDAIRAAAPSNAVVFIDRALDWVHRAVPYCQCVTGQGGDYRTDCSGLVSMAWGLPAPGNTTYHFAGGPWDNQRSVRLGSWDDIEIGDATNYPGDPDAHTGHIRIFAGWLNAEHTRYCSIEEYSTGHPAEIRPHDLDRSIYIPIRLAGWTPSNDDVLVRTLGMSAPPSTTDVDGDGSADVCGRSSAGWLCRSSDGRTFAGPALSDANGWMCAVAPVIASGVGLRPAMHSPSGSRDPS
jgi:hypothetical protein